MFVTHLQIIITFVNGENRNTQNKLFGKININAKILELISLQFLFCWFKTVDTHIKFLFIELLARFCVILCLRLHYI